jgi:hypothetical protein
VYCGSAAVDVVLMRTQVRPIEISKPGSPGYLDRVSTILRLNDGLKTS